MQSKGESLLIAVQSDRQLADCLPALEQFADDRDRPEVREWRRRLLEHRLRLLVVGEAKRGKSTLINALLGRRILPMGVIPLTAVVTTVAFDTDERVEVAYTDRTETAALSELADFVTERGNPRNVKHVREVRCWLDVPFLTGVEVVDTPGVGSVHEHNSREALAALRTMDAAVFVVSTDPPITALERAWLRAVRGQAVRVIFVLNKADYLSAPDLQEALAFTRQVLADELGYEPEIFALSAHDVLVAGDEGRAPAPSWQSFRAMLTAYLQTDSAHDLIESVRSRGLALVTSVLEQQATLSAALSLEAEQLEQRLDGLRSEMVRASVVRRDAAAVVGADIDRLQAQTAERAISAAGAALPEIRQTLAEYLAGRPGSLRDLEADGLRTAADLVRSAVDAWRFEHEPFLRTALHETEQSLASTVDEQIRRVRSIAADLFTVDLGMLPASDGLLDDFTLERTLGPDVGQADALAAAVRARLPGRIGRRRVEGYIDDRAADWLDRQMGRARSEFTARLREARQRLLRAADNRFELNVGRLAEAVELAGRLQHEGTASVVDRRALIDARRVAAERLAAQLTSAQGR